MFERQGLTTQAQIDQMRAELIDKKNGRIRKISRKTYLGYVFYTLLSLILIIALVEIMQIRRNGELPSLFGYHLFTVESGSMDPTLKVGDIIVSKKVSSADSLTTGSIVTFYNMDGLVVTHRITDVKTDDSGNTVYETKGDYSQNSTDTELLTYDRVISVYCFTLKHA